MAGPNDHEHPEADAVTADLQAGAPSAQDVLNPKQPAPSAAPSLVQEKKKPTPTPLIQQENVRLERERADVLRPAIAQFNPTVQVFRGMHDIMQGEAGADDTWSLTTQMLKESEGRLGLVVEDTHTAQFRDYVGESLSQADYDHRVARWEQNQQDMQDIMSDGILTGIGAILLGAVVDPTILTGGAVSKFAPVVKGLQSASRASRFKAGAAIGGSEGLVMESAIAFGNPTMDETDAAAGILLGMGIGGGMGAAMRKLSDGSPEELAHRAGEMDNTNRIVEGDNGLDDSVTPTAVQLDDELLKARLAREAEDAEFEAAQAADSGQDFSATGRDTSDFASEADAAVLARQAEEAGEVDPSVALTKDENEAAATSARIGEENSVVVAPSTSGSHILDNLPDLQYANMKTLREIHAELVSTIRARGQAVDSKAGRSKRDALGKINTLRKIIKRDEAKTAPTPPVKQRPITEDAIIDELEQDIGFQAAQSVRARGDDIEAVLMDPKRMKLDELKRTAVRMGIELPEGCK